MNREGLIFAFVVVELARHSMAPGPLTERDVLGFVPFEPEFDGPLFHIERDEIVRTLHRCETENLLRAYRSDYASTRYVVNRESLMEYLREQDGHTSGLVHQYTVLGISWLVEVLKNLDPDSTSRTAPSAPDFGSDFAPASDRVVQLDHNSRQVRELLVTLDDAIRELDGMNDRSTIDSDTLQRIFELKAGRAYLEGPQVDLSVVERILVAALRNLAKRTFSISVDTAIKAALAATVLYFFGAAL